LIGRAVEHHGAINASERGEDLGAFHGGCGWPGGIRRGVTVNATVNTGGNTNNQYVSQRARLLEEPNVTGMQQVKAAERAHYHLAVVLPPTPAGSQLRLRNNLTQSPVHRPLPLDGRGQPNFSTGHGDARGYAGVFQKGSAEFFAGLPGFFTSGEARAAP